MKTNHKPFYFMRHGQTDWNKEGKTGGNDNVPLNKAGEREAEAVQDLLASLPIEHIYHSPVFRVVQTVHIACKKLSCPRTPLDDLKEWDYGQWVGEHKDEYIQAHFDTLQPPGGQTREQFIERVTRALEYTQQNADHPLIVSHAGVYWAINHILQIPYESVENCQVVAFTHQHRGWQKEFLTWK